MTSEKSINKRNLTRHLMLPVVLLMLLTVFAAFVGWFALRQISAAQESVIDESFPLVNLARDISFNLTAINASAPQLINPGNEHLLFKRYAETSSQINTLVALVGHPTIAEQFPDKRNYVDKIKQIVDSMSLRITESMQLRDGLRKRVSDSLKLTQKVAEQLRPLDIDLTDKGLDITDEVYNNLDERNLANARQDVDQLIELNLSAETIRDVKESTAQLSTLLEGINPTGALDNSSTLTSRIEFTIRSMVSDTLSLADTGARNNILDNLDKLYNLLVKGGHLAIQLDDLSNANKHLETLYKDLQTNISVINSKTNELVHLAERTQSSSSSNARNVIRWSNLILIVIAISSLGLSALIAWLFIFKRTVTPINELTHAVESISRKKLDTTVADYPIHELSKMADALEVFRDNAIQLEAHEKQLSEQNELLKSINEELNAFVRVASHDLKSPLRGIVILAEFIREDIEKGEYDTVGEHLTTLESRIARMDKLLDSLLRFVRIGELSEASERVDITEVVHEAHELQHGKENFKLLIDSDLPVLNTHAAPLAQVFRNLFDNAIKHHDQLVGVLNVSCAELPTHYQFSVSDDGPGIPSRYHDKIFEVFQTLRPRDEIEGSGMGLSEVKKVVEKVGGKIVVASNAPDERGTTFTFTWPKVVDNAA